jgi:hypothetical protein
LQIIEYSDANETAVCNLGSISLGKFVDPTTRKFDYQKLMEVTRVLTRNLNRVIDINYYPVPEAKKSNMRHRPIGLGVQVPAAPACASIWHGAAAGFACKGRGAEVGGDATGACGRVHPDAAAVRLGRRARGQPVHLRDDLLRRPLGLDGDRQARRPVRDIQRMPPCLQCRGGCSA